MLSNRPSFERDNFGLQSSRGGGGGRGRGALLCDESICTNNGGNSLASAWLPIIGSNHGSGPSNGCAVEDQKFSCLCLAKAMKIETRDSCKDQLMLQAEMSKESIAWP